MGDEEIRGTEASVLLVDEIADLMGLDPEESVQFETATVHKIHAEDGSVDTWVEVDVTCGRFHWQRTEEIHECRILVNGVCKFKGPGRNLSTAWVMEVAQHHHDEEVTRLRVEKVKKLEADMNIIPNYGAF